VGRPQRRPPSALTMLASPFADARDQVRLGLVPGEIVADRATGNQHAADSVLMSCAFLGKSPSSASFDDPVGARDEC